MPEMREKWFAHNNYVRVLTEHGRSRLRAAFRKISFMDVWHQVPELVRDTLLGPKVEGERPAQIFEDNGMKMVEVEVLNSQIMDENIAKQMQKMQIESVALQIGDRQRQEAFRSTQLRDELITQTSLLEFNQKKAGIDLDNQLGLVRQTLKLAQIDQGHALKAREQEFTLEREGYLAQKDAERNSLLGKASLALEKEKAKQDLELEEERRELEIKHKAALAEIEKAILAAKADATRIEHESVQDGLVEAIAGLGDKTMLSEVAENMNLISLFKGKDVGTVLSEILGGTKLMPTLEKLREKFPSVEINNSH